MALLGERRRLHWRYERKPEHFLAFTAIAAGLINHRRLTSETSDRLKRATPTARPGTCRRPLPCACYPTSDAAARRY